MTRDDLIALCRERHIGRGAIDWLATLPASASVADAWVACPRGDWMLWLAVAAGVDRRRVVKAACDCAWTALAHVSPDEERPARAIAVARAWARGEATAADVREAAVDAYYAACGVVGAAGAAARAASAAAAAAYADDVRAFAAADAAADADAAAAASAACAAATRSADEAAARAAAYARHAAIVRVDISAVEVEAAMEAADAKGA